MAKKKYMYNRGGSSINMEEAIKIGKRLDNGETGAKIAKEYGVSEMSIVRIRKRFSKKMAQKRYATELRNQVRLLALNYTPKEISDHYNLPYHTVYRWINRKPK